MTRTSDLTGTSNLGVNLGGEGEATLGDSLVFILGLAGVERRVGQKDGEQASAMTQRSYED
jgi:hypothetical protein